jgi:hypothetical protein
MNDAQTLLTIAQLAVGLAGFTGIVSALLSGNAANGRMPNRGIRQLLETSLGAAAYAFVPILAFPVAGSEHLAWCFSNAFLGVAHTITLLVSINRAGGLRKAVVGHTGVYVQSMRLGGIITIALNFAAAYDALPAPWQSSVYMLGLLYLLFVASHTFVRLLFDIESAGYGVMPAQRPAGEPVAPRATIAPPPVVDVEKVLGAKGVETSGSAPPPPVGT